MPAFSPSDPNSNNVSSVTSTPDNLSVLRKIGGYSGTGAEISAFDPISKRLFIVSGSAEVPVLDLSNPGTPTLVQTIDLSGYGDGADSVAVSNGLVAVAVQADSKTDPGKVVFLNASSRDELLNGGDCAASLYRMLHRKATSLINFLLINPQPTLLLHLKPPVRITL